MVTPGLGVVDPPDRGVSSILRTNSVDRRMQVKGQVMHASRVLGAVALASVVIAAVSFGVVDVAISGGCDDAPCSSGVPVLAITFAALGGLALLVSILPAVTWIVEAVRGNRHADHAADHDDVHDADREAARAARPRSHSALDEDD